ncbi:hypothetical protein D9M71_253090 [compost metagenome]
MRVDADTSHVSNDIALSLAQLGQGVALATDVLVKRQLREGSLVRWTEAAVALESYQVLTPQPEVSADVIWFIDWLRRALREEFPEAIH